MAEKDPKKVDEKVNRPVMTVQEATDQDQILNVLTSVFSTFQEKLEAEPPKATALPPDAASVAIRFNNLVADLQFKPRPRPPFLQTPEAGVTAVDLRWTVTEQTGEISEFHIKRAVGAQNEDFNKIKVLPASARDYHDDTVARGTTYRYMIVAITARGEVPSEPKNATTGQST
jgi:hypothetical protein